MTDDELNGGNNRAGMMNRENAYRCIINHMLDCPVGGVGVERFEDKYPTFYGWRWSDIMFDPVAFVHHIRGDRT